MNSKLLISQNACDFADSLWHQQQVCHQGLEREIELVLCDPQSTSHAVHKDALCSNKVDIHSSQAAWPEMSFLLPVPQHRHKTHPSKTLVHEQQVFEALEDCLLTFILSIVGLTLTTTLCLGTTDSACSAGLGQTAGNGKAKALAVAYANRDNKCQL